MIKKQKKIIFENLHFFCQINCNFLIFIYSWEGGVYLKRKPWIAINETSFETWRFFFVGGSRRVLVNEILFQLFDHKNLGVKSSYSDSK